MTERKPLSFNRPATRADLGFAIAETVLALKSMKLAIMALRRGESAVLEHQLADMDRFSEKLWDRFQDLTGPDDE